MLQGQPPLAAVAIALAALAGFVDALAFASLGGFFAAFMSGNSTRLGVALGNGANGEAMVALALVLSFVAGVILASVAVRAAPAAYRPLVVGATAVLLAVAAVVSGIDAGTILALPLAGAMGAAHLLVHREGAAAGGVSLTAALVRAGEALAGALIGDRERWGWLPHLLLWVGFVAGAVLGAGAQLRFGGGGLWLAAAAAAALAGWLALPRAKRSTAAS
ncbi:MAG: YoaK family protein [Sphingomonas sp.]